MIVRRFFVLLTLVVTSFGVGGERVHAESVPIQTTVHEGTQFAFALSPDHARVVMDLQGTLFVMPAKGGDAKAITDNLFDAREPSWSPDGSKIAFQSDRTGHWQIWVVGADGSNPHPVTTGIQEGLEPAWSPDGKHIAFTSDRDGKFDIWQVNLDSGAVTQISRAPGGNSRASWAPDGEKVVYVSDRRGAPGIYASDLAGNEQLIYKADVVPIGMTVPLGTPAYSPNGDKLLYTTIAYGKATLMLNGQPVTQNEDVFPARPQWIDNDTFLYAADGKLKRRSLTDDTAEVVPFSATFTVRKPEYAKRHHDFDSTAPQPVVGIQRAVISPDGKQIAFAALGNLWLMPVDGEPQRVTDNDPYEVANPVWSPDGKQIVFSSDRHGSFDLWIYDLGNQKLRRITSSPGAEMRAAWSPDGQRIAYANVTGWSSAVLEVLDLDTGKVRAYENAGGGIGYPQWSPDGKAIMVSRIDSFSTSQSNYAGGEFQFAIVPVDGGEVRDVTLDPAWSVGEGAGDGPIWSPDGRWIAYRRAAAIWIAPLTPDGESAGDAHKLSNQVVTALSWAADSRTLLAQAGGELTVYDTVTGERHDVPMPLTWTRARPEGLVTLHVGKLVDGVHKRALNDIDIVIDGNRIIAIEPHGTAPVRGKLIDASNLTAMPGLIDSHIHYHKFLGSNFGRIMLAYGITSVRSPGNVPGEVLSEREAIDAGLHPGPRLFPAGYILEGERTSGGVSIRSREEADRTLAFHHRVGFDIVKTYIHTDEPLRKYILGLAHGYGMLATSHDFYPAAAWGTDSVEHLDGNNCGRGYCTKTSQLNLVYGDVVHILAAAGMTITPTISLFTPTAQYAAGDPNSADDPRNALQPDGVRGEAPFNFGSRPGGGILVDNIRRSILRLHEAGVKIVVGTDAPITNLGISTHNEMKQEVKAGLTPYEALQSATTVPAAMLGVTDDLGSIELGKLADIVLVEGNPLVDIHDSIKVRQVMKNGVLYSVPELVRRGAGVDNALGAGR